MKRLRKSYIIIFTLSVFMALAAITYLFLIGNKDTKELKISYPDETENLAALKAVVSPTPFPFQDVTIPYLRNRSYQSSMGTLEKLSENGSYISYDTNYNSDGFKVFGLLSVPKGEKPVNGWPAVIFLHGYIPPARYRTAVNYASYVDHFARNGFVVFKIDYRGHDRSEGEASGGYYSGDYIIDTLNAYSALQKSDFVDRQAIGLWGHSMSGNVVLRSVAANPDIPAAVIWAGAVYTYSDMQEYGIEDKSYTPPDPNSESAKRRNKLRELYGNFNEESWFWRQIPATNYLDGIKTAIQIHHATDDAVVPIDYSRNLMKILDDTSILHELYEYPSGGHNLTGPSFDQAMRRSEEFFIKHLK